jgi:putative peptidoglycan lipid II flippase
LADHLPSSATDAPQQTTDRSLFLRSAGVVAASVLLSRLLGFFREWTLASQIGSNGLTDAYYAAFTIPDILNYLLAGGALSITFLPVFISYFSTRRKDEAWHVFSIVLTVLCSVLLVLLFVAEIWAHSLTRWIAPGFDPERHELVTHLTRIMLPAQAFFFIGGVLSAVQYAQGRFLIPSLAPLVYNGMIILFGVLLSDRIGVEAFSWGVLGGSLLGNCLLQIYGVRRLSAQFRLSFDLLHPGFRRFVRLSIPIMVGFSLLFVDDWAIRWFGSYLIPASITWLGYGKTLMRVVVGVFGQSAGVAAYPILARLAAEEKWDAYREGIQDALRRVVLTVIPASVLLALMSHPMVFVLFSRTRLAPTDMDQTALALQIFLIGAVGWAGQAILGRGFYALGDTLTPTLIGSGMMLASLPVYWVLAREYQHLGLAAASSAGVILYSAALYIVLFRRLKITFRNFGWFFCRVLFSAGLAGIIAGVFHRWLRSVADLNGMAGSILQVTILTLVFLSCFAVFASWTRLAAWRDLGNILSLLRGRSR